MQEEKLPKQRRRKAPRRHVQSKEISEAEGGDKAQEESLREVGQLQQGGRTNHAMWR